MTTHPKPKADGYSGIWYEIPGAYCGGLGTYCAKHRPFAVYRPEVDKTFFCYGGSDGRSLLHMVSYFNHDTGTVPRPTILLDKQTMDAHDNPVISMDPDGHIWVFSTSHGRGRPSFIHRSVRPHDIERFERVEAEWRLDGEVVPLENFSYMQPWWVPGRGIVAFVTRYQAPVLRTTGFMTSSDGRSWSAWQRLGVAGQGHYQVSAMCGERAGVIFNLHPPEVGQLRRTNLYYLETPDWGATWQNAAGQEVAMPVETADHPSLVHDYEAEDLLVFLKHLTFDAAGRPVALFLTGGGKDVGPENGPRVWRTGRWTGREWEIRRFTESDNNYDMGELVIEPDGTWRIIAPTAEGPQKWWTGGEMVLWTSEDRGATWQRVRQLTRDSEFNHTYARHPLNAHPGFYALWVDGHAEQPSPSRLYFCTKDGQVFRLPTTMEGDFAEPEPLGPE